ncbi:CinA-like protein [Neisseria meningitidis]|nr:CinA-like protein [Neisseria meningitidis]
MNAFNLIIIGDEILHGSRQDKHFVFFKSLLESKGLKLNQVQYLPDEPDLLVKQLRRSFSDGMPTFVTGGIGATPDDHTRQAAAAALDLPVVRHAQAAGFIEGVTLKRGEPLDSPEHAQRLKMADFPQGAELVPNPFNNIAGFSIREHYFFPGFPVMAHPMAEWVLDTYYAGRFNQTQRGSRSVLCVRAARIAHYADYGAYRANLSRGAFVQPAQRRLDAFRRHAGQTAH